MPRIPELVCDLPEEVPFLDEWIKKERADWLADEIKYEKEYMQGTEKISPLEKLTFAAASDRFDDADEIMDKQGWTGASKPDINNSRTLMFHACDGNSKFHKMMYYKLLLYLADRDPACVVSRFDGETMLHTTFSGAENPVVIKELLSRGANPYATNQDKKTYLEVLEAEFLEKFPGGILPDDAALREKLSPCVQQWNSLDDLVVDARKRYENYQTIISMVKNFMDVHKEDKCAEREALIAQTSAKSHVGRVAGTSHGWLSH